MHSEATKGNRTRGRAEFSKSDGKVMCLSKKTDGFAFSLIVSTIISVYCPFKAANVVGRSSNSLHLKNATTYNYKNGRIMHCS